MPKTFLPSKQVGLEHAWEGRGFWLLFKDLRTLYMFHKFYHVRNHYSATSDSHLSPFFLSFFFSFLHAAFFDISFALMPTGKF